MTARYIVADVFDGLASLEENSVDLIFTSPPFLALRSYLPADHPDKGKEIGSEATPGAFIDTLLDVVEACDRVLAPHGTLCVELGDSYSGSGGAGGDYMEGGWRQDAPSFKGTAKHSRVHDPAIGPPIMDMDDKRQGGGPGWPMAKSLCMVPESFRWALAYGRNPFTGRETPRWRIRNKVPWCRPNPPVGALGDKWRPAHSDVVVACKARDRWFDLEAVRHEPLIDRPPAIESRDNKETRAGDSRGDYPVMRSHPNGAPPLDYLVLPTQPFSGAHYATFPQALVVPFVKSMAPLRVCRVCGEPSRRMVEKTEEYAAFAAGRSRSPTVGQDARSEVTGGGRLDHHSDAGARGELYDTLGWTDCGHDSYRPGCVLDPFAGSGTTLSVATGHGRDAIGIDLDARNAELALERVGGLFLTVETVG